MQPDKPADSVFADIVWNQPVAADDDTAYATASAAVSSTRQIRSITAVHPAAGLEKRSCDVSQSAHF
jgi:hypothetical protein